MQESVTPAVNFEQFSLAYSNHKGRRVLQVVGEISLRVRQGEIITIVGPSGCGKTTLLRAIAGLLTPREDAVICHGLLRVLGMTPSEAKKLRTFAYTFQNPVLLPWRTVSENVALPLEVMNGTNKAHEALVSEMLSLVGINDFAKAMPFELSGGMQQRVNLARALVQMPKIVLMDEPFGSLDEVTRERLNFELLRIQRIRKPTILFVTHNISEAALIADRIVILTRRPSTVRAIITVELEEHRTDKTLVSTEYLDLVRTVREVFSREDTTR